MKSTQVTTWRRYTAAEKKAYQDRIRRRALGLHVKRRDQLDYLARLFLIPSALLVPSTVTRRHLIIDTRGAS